MDKIVGLTLMANRFSALKPALLGATLILSGMTAPVALAGPEDEPSGAEMMVDAVIARPIGVATTVVGVAAFVVTLPFSALGGNINQAADKLIVEPGKETFVRCLGCRHTGRPDRFRGDADEIR